MKNVSFDYLFESDIAKIVKNKGASNTIKLEALKKMVALAMKQDLTPRQRKILDMYFVRGMKYNQIADILKVNKSTISRTKSRAFKTLFKILKYYRFKF